MLALFLGRPMQPTQFVAVRVAQVSQVELAHRTITKARRLFTRHAAVGNPGRMPGLDLFGRVHLETNRAAVAVASRLAIDGRADREGARLAAVEVPVLVGDAGSDAQRAEQRVVKLL